jgi:hypothetical protein
MIWPAALGREKHWRAAFSILSDRAWCALPERNNDLCSLVPGRHAALRANNW